MRSASRTAPARPVAPDWTIANSSPPIRARVSLSRTHAPQPLRHRHQHPVPGEVAEAVIHGLEVVQIEVVQRDRLALPLAAAQRLIQPIVEQPAVRQVGQRVVMRQVPDAVARGGGIGEQAADMSGLAHQQPDQDAAADQDAEQVAELLQVQPVFAQRAAHRNSGRPLALTSRESASRGAAKLCSVSEMGR